MFKIIFKISGEVLIFKLFLLCIGIKSFFKKFGDKLSIIRFIKIIIIVVIFFSIKLYLEKIFFIVVVVILSIIKIIENFRINKRLFFNLLFF